MNMNSVTLVGRAGSDPIARYYESGSIRVTLDLIVKRRNADEDTYLFPLEIWGKQAQLTADHVRKDSLIGIIGSIHRQATDAKQDSTYIRVDRLEILGGPRQGNQ